MLKQVRASLLKSLPKYIPNFPVILNTQKDIFQAESSGDLSFGMLEVADEPKLPERIRYLVSMLYEHPNEHGQNLFFNFNEKRSHPFSEERLKARKDTWDKLHNVLTQYQHMTEQNSALLRYMRSGSKEVRDQARIELITLVLHEWNSSIYIDSTYLDCLDVFRNARKHFFKSIFLPNRTQFENAKKYMEQKVGNDPLLYHHAWGIGITLWSSIEKLHEDIHKPEFKQMLMRDEWSPASFLAQHNIPPRYSYRVTANSTNLGGVLKFTLPSGRLVMFESSAAEDSQGLFLNVCCAGSFVMEMLTLLVDYVHVDMRKQSSNQAIKQSSNQAIKQSSNQAIKQSSCPYKHKIRLPLY